MRHNGLKIQFNPCTFFEGDDVLNVSNKKCKTIKQTKSFQKYATISR